MLEDATSEFGILIMPYLIRAGNVVQRADTEVSVVYRYKGHQMHSVLLWEFRTLSRTRLIPVPVLYVFSSIDYLIIVTPVLWLCHDQSCLTSIPWRCSQRPGIFVYVRKFVKASMADVMHVLLSKMMQDTIHAFFHIFFMPSCTYYRMIDCQVCEWIK